MDNGAEILLRHLPEVFHDLSKNYPSSDDSSIKKVLPDLLDAFGEVLFGSEGSTPDGLDQIITNLPNLFDPRPGQVVSNSTLERTPNDFLPWLSDWVALGQLNSVPEDQQRVIISQIIPLYACRGTKRYLKEILRLFFPEIQVSINDKELPSLKVGQSRVGIETRLGGDLAFCFFVELQLKTTVQEQLQQHEQLLESIRSVINLAKPAHTAYQLECVFEG